jgi:single-stranded-DNA-specific exonuclease
MKYRLYENGNNNSKNVLKEVLNNRGINDYNTYLNLTDDVIIPYKKLDNIKEAVDVFDYHFSNKHMIKILFDTDVDGITSGSAMFNYIKRMESSYPVEYIIHTRAKAHGLSNDIVIDDNTKLLIIPDAASNDIEQCKLLNERGIDVIILDHHEIENENKYAIVVNNQSSPEYENKALSGVGIVYKFLQALDDYYWNEYADEYLDLVALGNIGDMMDIKSYETRHIINKGMANIKNKCLEAFIKAQDYSMNGKVNIHNMQWYIVPVINAMIRIGSSEEKELLVNAFIERDKLFEYKTRATKDKPSEVIQESIYDRAARLSKNAKSRQDKLKEKSVSVIIDKANDECSNEDKVIIVDGTEIVDNGLTGVIAMKVAEMFNKPCILLNKHIEEENIINKDTGEEEKVTKIVYGGSSRNINNSPIDNLKDIVNAINVFDYAQGHGNAFGIKLQLDKVTEAREKLNILLQNVVYESTYVVDFILDCNEVSLPLINDINKLENVIGQGIDESRIAVENIKVNKRDIELIGKNSNTVKFINNDIEYIMFNCKEGNVLFDWINDTWCEDSSIEINVVGKPSINEFGNIRTPQIKIDDISIIRTYENESVEEDADSVW